MKKLLASVPFFVSLLLVMGCAPTIYTPNQSVLQTMTFQEAKSKAESLFAQLLPGGNLKVHPDHLEISSPYFRSYCYFKSIPIEIKDYGPLAGAGEYPIGSRYVVSLGLGQDCEYIMFKEYQDAVAFADAAFVLKNTTFQVKESFFLTPKQGENGTTFAPPASKPDMVAIPHIFSDIDELPAIKAKANRNAYAIVIGIENYRQKLPSADFATQDARLVADYLVKALGYSEENVITLLNDHASNVDLVKYFEKWLPNNVEAGNSVFVYFSGHGAPNPKTGDAYLVPYDGDPSFIDQTGYSLKRMYEALGKLPANEILVALDSCFSGAGGRSVLAEGARPLVMNQKSSALPKNVTVLAAASGDQISSTYKDKGHGLFTYFMLKGIKNENVGKQDGSIQKEELYRYLKPQVERIARKQFNAEQTPQLIMGSKTHDSLESK